MLNIDDRLIKDLSPKIKPNALSVLLAISIHLSKKNGKCFPSHERLMMLTGLGRDAVYAALDILKKNDLLLIEQSIDSKNKKFGQRTFKVPTKLIKIYVDAEDVEPVTENPYTGEPETDEPYTANPETQLLNESYNDLTIKEQLNNEGVAKIENSTPLPNFTPFKEQEKEKNIIPAAGGGSAAADASEADGIISKWSADNLETVKMWHERSKRIFSLQEYDRLVLKFCGHYANHKEDGTQKRFLLNPLLFFRNQFPGWLADQPKFDRAQPHQAPSPQRGIEAGSLPKNLRRV